MSRTPVVVRTAEVTPSHRMGAAIYPLLTPASAGTHAGFLAQAVLEPGEEVSEHYHPWTDEHVLVVSGAVQIVVDGTPLDLVAGDATYIRRGARHVMRQTGDETARVVLFLGPLAPDPADGHVDTVPVPRPDAAPPRVG